MLVLTITMLTGLAYGGFTPHKFTPMPGVLLQLMFFGTLKTQLSMALITPEKGNDSFETAQNTLGGYVDEALKGAFGILHLSVYTCWGHNPIKILLR